MLPSWRAREINDERRKVQERNEVLEAQLARYQAAQLQAERQAQPQKFPDPIVDANAYTAALDQRIEEKLAVRDLNMNLAMNNKFYGEKFRKAYDAVCAEAQRGNTALRDQLIRQYDPGEAIMQWHAQQETLKVFGSDPAAAEARIREDERNKLLNDPNFQAQRAEHQRAAAMGGQQSPPRTVVRLPPSLSKVTGSSAAETQDTIKTQTDGSEAALFDYAWRR